MLQKKIKIFTLFGFEVGIDPSWIIIAVLVVWSLSSGVFSGLYPDLARKWHWVMGVVGAVGLFLSIIFHEFWHSLVARQYGLPMKGITLFIFGGVAEMDKDPDSPKAEFMMAVAGPVSSLVLALGFYGLYVVGSAFRWPVGVNGVINYLAVINLVLALFNMIPAFPLDGGRVLRSILWGAKKDLKWATKVSAGAGSAFGVVLIVFGVFSFIRGNFIGGLWWFLIGLFLRNIAQTSHQRLVTKQALQGEPLSRFMKRNPITAPPTATIREFVEEYIYKHHYKFFPVTDADGKLVGCIGTREIKEAPREEWDKIRVGDLANECSIENSIRPDAEAVDALMAMKRNGVSRMMVTEGDRLIGVVALKDLLDFLALKLDLEG